MKKVLFYGMTGEKMCFQHIFLNAIDLHEAGYEVKIIFEGASVKLLPQFHKENNPLYLKSRELGLIAGVCLACSRVMGVYDENEATGLPLLGDMSGHAGMKPFMEDDYLVISM
ncbi:MAG: hypothetical protein GX763_09075 [Clostridiaceae bacterium]|nr:hypothetical protein [Clostridiaceae bacterium]